MSGSSGCEYCNVLCKPIDMEKHIIAKHNVSERDNTGYVEMSFTIEEKDYDVLYNEENNQYRCKVCNMQGVIEDIRSHLENKHYRSLEEKQFDRQVARSERIANMTYCDICWVFFKDGADSLECIRHFTTRSHLQYQRYVEGTGCDICRTTADPLRDHLASKQHFRAANYVDGTGCNICKEATTSLDYHYRVNTFRHANIQQYKEGTGCDICRMVYPTHENSNLHKKRVKARDYIYKTWIAPRLRAKSARK